MNTQIQKNTFQNFNLKSYDDVTKFNANIDKTELVKTVGMD